MPRMIPSFLRGEYVSAGSPPQISVAGGNNFVRIGLGCYITQLQCTAFCRVHGQIGIQNRIVTVYRGNLTLITRTLDPWSWPSCVRLFSPQSLLELSPFFLFWSFFFSFSFLFPTFFLNFLYHLLSHTFVFHSTLSQNLYLTSNPNWPSVEPYAQYGDQEAQFPLHHGRPNGRTLAVLA